MIRPVCRSRQATTWRKRPSTTAPANQLGSRRKATAIRPAMGVAARTWRRSASSSGVASSNRYRLIDGLPLGQTGTQAQSLPAVDVQVRLQVQSQVDAKHREAAQVRLAVPQSLPD